jgi:NADH:ubiquinone oxidoreductase subunit 4 (subunit M)
MSNAQAISIYTPGKKWQNSIFLLLALLGVFFLAMFIFHDGHTTSVVGNSFLEFRFDKLSLFIGTIFCTALFGGIVPVRHENDVTKSFIFYILGGIGIIFSNNLLTFFIFWTFQRSLPAFRFIRGIRNESTTGGGTYLVQHFIAFSCLIALIVIAGQSGYATMSFSYIPASFFTWPVLILAFIIIFETHGIFPFHSWIHDLVGNINWYKTSSLFLARAGVLLFVKFLLPTFAEYPDLFKISLLSLSIFSSIYWSVRGIYETNVAKVSTYFYVAQSALVLTGLQADEAAGYGAYLQIMVISFSGTALWSLLSYVQRHTSIKRLNQFYGLAQFYPKLATLFCLFGFSMIGTPLGAAFVVEDLVINGLLDLHPFLGLGHILATCLNGILFFLIFSKLFLGQTSYPQKIKNLDMSLTQMLPYILILFGMFIIGIMPSPFLGLLKW